MRISITSVNGKEILLDAEDYNIVRGYSWVANSSGNTFYARAKVDRPENGCGKGWIQMHRVITSATPGVEVHHIDGNGLNNQRSNLRLCSHSENMRSRFTTWGISKFKGVSIEGGRWKAQIKFNGKLHRLGNFADEVEAAIAYDDAARKYYGDFAVTNF